MSFKEGFWGMSIDSLSFLVVYFGLPTIGLAFKSFVSLGLTTSEWFFLIISVISWDLCALGNKIAYVIIKLFKYLNSFSEEIVLWFF